MFLLSINTMHTLVNNTHTHTHIHTYVCMFIYIYIYIYSQRRTRWTWVVVTQSFTRYAIVRRSSDYRITRETLELQQPMSI